MKPHLFAKIPSELPPPPPSSAPSLARAPYDSGLYRRSPIRSGAVRYELIELLACGGMASVFLGAQCHDASIDRLVALKVPHPSPEDSGGWARKQLLREARLGARLSHPSVVRTLDLVSDADRSHLVLEYVEGISLRDVLTHNGEDSPPVPPAMAVGIVRDLLAGLDALHRVGANDPAPLGLVHRDVAPGNVLVGVDGRARLTDFGLARTRAERDRSASTHIEGTIRYLSPEQARGEPLDLRADVFAAGILLFELLTGQRLYQGGSSSEIVRRACQGPLRAPLDLETADIPQALREICTTALATRRDHRYPSARAFSRALGAAARSTVGIASHDATGEWIDARFGARIDRQRQRIAEWRAGMERRDDPSAPIAEAG